jgi:hypothetical protein
MSRCGFGGLVPKEMQQDLKGETVAGWGSPADVSQL